MSTNDTDYAEGDKSWADWVLELPKNDQGPEIDRAIEAQIETGTPAVEAVETVAGLLGMKPGTVSVSYYRRKKKARAPELKSQARWTAFEKLINEIVEERVAERLEAARKALA